MTNRPILLVDFDGVIHSYTSLWKGADVVADGPVPGAIRWLIDAADHFDVQIYSSRSKDPAGVDAMIQAIDAWAAAEGLEAPPLSFPAEKPPAFLTIDDRAIQFNGDWSTLDPRELLAFKPWNKR